MRFGRYGAVDAHQEECETYNAERIERVAVIGAGLIGSRWSALFLANGLEVTVADPAPNMEARLIADVERCMPALMRMGLPAARDFDGECSLLEHLKVVEEIEDAVCNAEFIQECVGDDDDLKLDVFRRIDATCPPWAVIASSTSGILPTFLQSACTRPERVLVGHPFNPVHIIPLVEVVPGEATRTDVVHSTVAFYRRVGKKPLVLHAEAPGFVANRLQEAIWRELFHLVNEGLATTEEVDVAITNGPGLRWALYGPAFIYMLQGGRGGMAHALSQFDPTRITDWSHNSYPEMTPDLIRRLDTQTREQAGGRSLAEWEDLRDEFLIRALELKRKLLQD